MNKLIVWVLIAALLGSAQERPKEESVRIRRCVEALELLAPSHNEDVPTARTSETQKNLSVRLVDLSKSPESEISGKISKANKSDIFVVSEDVLRNDAALSAINSSPALFSIKAPTTPTKQLEETLRLPILQPEIVIALPIDAKGVHAVFGTPEDVAGAQVEYLNKLMPKFKRLRGGALVATARLGGSIADSILQRTGKPNEHSLFVLVAHNREGFLHFPDGSKLSVTEIYKDLQRIGRPGLILSCDTVRSSEIPSGAILTNTPLDIASIARALDRMQSETATVPSVAVADALQILAKTLYSAPPDLGPRIKAIVYIAGGLILVFGALYFWKCDVDDSCKN